MNNEKRRDLLEEAQRLVSEAQRLVDEAVEGTSRENNYRAYGRYGFDQLLENGNPNDDGLNTLLEEFEY